MSAAKVLLVEDHTMWQRKLSKHINLALTEPELRVCCNFEEASTELKQGTGKKWDLLVTDLSLPEDSAGETGGNEGSSEKPLGLDLVALAKEAEVPCVVVSGSNRVEKKHIMQLIDQRYLPAGIFDKECLACDADGWQKFRALVCKLVGLVVDRKTFSVRWRGETRVLGNTMEFRLIECLNQKQGQWVSHEDLCTKAWGDDQVLPNTIHKTVSNLRKKLPDDLARAIVSANGNYMLKLP